MNVLPPQALSQLFTEAHTHHAFEEAPLPESELRALYDLLKWAPTSFNCSPARFVFVTSKEAKEKLKLALAEGNIRQTMQAPVTVIVAIDSQFYEELPRLYPPFDAKPIFVGNPALAQRAGMQNGSLQAAYLIMAARALGLDCGPMTGFDPVRLDELFFPDGRWKSNILVNLGHGAAGGIHPRNPRLPFEEACQIV